MSATPDWFSDLLVPGESVVAGISGPGPSVRKAVGDEHIWFQLGFTQGRLLVVRLVQSALGGGWQPTQRYAVERHHLVVRRYPRTPGGPARLEIEGAGALIQLQDIDEAERFPAVEPFLRAYGGPVGGDGEVRAIAPDPISQDPRTETRKLLLLVGVGFALLAGCCGCSGLTWVIRSWLAT